MAKQTQSFRLFELLKGGQEVSVRVLSDTLGVKDASIPVYIHELKNKFKADIASIRSGRKVTGYQLLNVSKTKVPEFRKNAVGEIPVKPAAKIQKSLAEELDSVNTGTVSDREFADIRNALGINFGGSYGSSSNNDY